MRYLWHFGLLLLAANPSCGFPALQEPLQLEYGNADLLRPSRATNGARALLGKFLHISGIVSRTWSRFESLPTYLNLDLHADPFYKYHSSTEKDNACHRGRGPAGILGAETTDCDSPVTLINETFRWIKENLRDEIDFVIWTGDSARHDNDEHFPRTETQVLELNNLIVDKFVEVFGTDDNANDTDPTNDMAIPIVPTYGNNDILPHNIFTPGPNRWTKNYLHVWKRFIPEEQRHAFERGGWFSVEVIPNRLAVFSLNTLYFFSSNAAVDGCAQKSEPGYQQMEWLRIQLQFIRERSMKAIMMGHVPPARTSSKRSWDNTCWQKYTLWMEQYRDVVVGSLYGHMNIDHFMLQDFDDISLFLDVTEPDLSPLGHLDNELSIESASDYLEELRARWSKLPDPPKQKGVAASDISDNCSASSLVSRLLGTKTKKGNTSNKNKAYEKFLDKIGGRWGERFSLSLVSPSIVPNYYPTLRVIHYNTTGLNPSTPGASIEVTATSTVNDQLNSDTLLDDQYRDSQKKRKPKHPKFQVPQGPSKSTPPGPAYSPQTFTWLGYTQYYANLTTFNRDFSADDERSLVGGGMESSKWKDGRHSGKKPKDKNTKAPLKSFRFQEEYDTRTDKIYGLKDLTVRSYFDLANRIGRYKARKSDEFLLVPDYRNPNDFESKGVIDNPDMGEINSITYDDGDLNTNNLNKNSKEKKKKKHKKHENRKAMDQVWLSFVRRAFVSSRDDDDLFAEFG